MNNTCILCPQFFDGNEIHAPCTRDKILCRLSPTKKWAGILASTSLLLRLILNESNVLVFLVSFTHCLDCSKDSWQTGFLKREILEKIYLTFIRPLLVYSCEVWDNCSQTDNDRLEKLQLEAARIVTVFSSRDSLYLETGWEKWSSINVLCNSILYWYINL
jgi:hypothetical protein